MKTTHPVWLFIFCAFGSGTGAFAKTRYEYDAIDRIEKVVSGSVVMHYSYDASGNVVKKTIGKITDSTHVIPSVGAGVYGGLAQSSSATLGNSLLKLTVGTGCSFTGTLSFHGTSYPLKGAFVAGEGGVFVWNGSLHRLGQSNLVVALRFDPSDPSGAITGTIFDGTDSARVALARAGFDAKHPTALAGNYTVLLPANPDFIGDAYPQGDGYALLSVTAAGSVRLTGKLGDGAVVTQSAPLSSDGRFAVHLPLYKNRGVLAGWVDFQPVDEVSDFNGTLHWTKAEAAGGPLYGAGFDLEVDFMGSRFVPPLAGHRILNLANSANNSLVFLGEGNLGAELNFATTLDAANAVRPTATAPQAFQLKIMPSTGLFTGSFLHSATHKKAVFSGVVFQKQSLAAGFFPGSDKSGYVSLHRTATSFLLLPPACVLTPSNELTHPPADLWSGDEFAGTTLDAAKWSTENSSSATVANGTVVIEAGGGNWGGYISTSGKVAIQRSSYVVEYRARRSGNYDLVCTLTDGTNGINLMESSYPSNVGLLLTTTGAFGTSAQANNQPTTDWKEYRVTVNGKSVTFQRGDTLSNLTENLSTTLDSSVADYPLFLRFGCAGGNFAEIDWVRVR